jgi:hypothetical protein
LLFKKEEIEMKRFIIIVLAILTLTVLFAENIFADIDRVEKVMEESFILENNGSFSLANVAGNIEVNSWDKEEVKMMATKSISSRGTDDPEELLNKIEIEIFDHFYTNNI